jgi:hypothetical protein
MVDDIKKELADISSNKNNSKIKTKNRGKDNLSVILGFNLEVDECEIIKYVA